MIADDARQEFCYTHPMTETMEFDVVIVGAGPAGLSAAIKLMQDAKAAKRECNVAVLEKGSEVGAHILSGAVIETRALDELLPDWKELGAPLLTEVKEDHFALLTKKSAVSLPTPPQMHNEGNYIISLGALCRWLAKQAEALGVQIFAGFPAADAIIEDGVVKGVRTGEFGVAADGSHKSGYQPAMELRATYTLLGEGARGSVSKQLIKHFSLRQGREPQTYALGLKEVWEIDADKHEMGKAFHSVGWPLDQATYGGSFLYHWDGDTGDKHYVSLGFVIGLDYKNPHLDTYETLQTFKTHPQIAALLEGGKRLSYGARALNEGGWQSIPKLAFPGGALIGCAAGFVNVAKIKGTHTAMKSGMLAAEAISKELAAERPAFELSGFEPALKSSWIGEELRAVRNIRPSFHYGLYAGLAYSALDTYVLRGKAPWTFGHGSDHQALNRASDYKPYHYAEHDGVLTFNKLDSVYLTSTNHEEDQPCHLVLRDKDVPVKHNLPLYDNPETRYCPAGVYEMVTENGETSLQINAQNCIHCKSCDIKDPTQNINWVTPEGGGGPNYGEM